MYDTSGTQSVCTAYHPDYNVNERVSWLKAELARDEAAPAAAKLAAEEARAAVMDDPRTSEQAYAALGLLLGLLPPAAIFGRALFSMHNAGGNDISVMFGFCLLMNLICCAVGCAMGRCFGRKIGDPRRRAPHELMMLALLYAILWAIVTGGSGGVIVFGIGAMVGIACAAPVALAGFLLFAPLHRLLSRGGMIEARHLRPLALGIAGFISALILSPSIFQ